MRAAWIAPLWSGKAEAAACTCGLAPVPRPEMPGLHHRDSLHPDSHRQRPHCGSSTLTVLDSVTD